MAEYILKVEPNVIEVLRRCDGSRVDCVDDLDDLYCVITDEEDRIRQYGQWWHARLEELGLDVHGCPVGARHGAATELVSGEQDSARSWCPVAQPPSGCEARNP